MVPVEFLRRERGLAVHLESERLVELSFGSKRQADGLAQHIGLAQAKHRVPARHAGQVGHTDRSESKMAERALLAVMPLIDGNSFGPLLQGTDRSDHQRIAGTQRRSAQFLRQQVRKLCAPPIKELAKHDPTRSRSNSSLRRRRRRPCTRQQYRKVLHPSECCPTEDSPNMARGWQGRRGMAAAPQQIMS